MKNRLLVIALTTTALVAPAVIAPDLAAEESNSLVNKLLDQIVAREHRLLDTMRARTPMVETYIQEESAPISTSQTDERPVKDHYFLGRFHIGQTVDYEPLADHNGTPVAKENAKSLKRNAARNQNMSFLPRGFAQMSVIDATDFNRQTYSFDFVRREFLGEVRCLVFDVTPIVPQQPGRFVGRIWVEDRDQAIVRFNGTYVPELPGKNKIPERYFHFDSWRTNIADGEWVPSQIYVEESGESGKNGSETPRFKAQTRIWDYAAAPTRNLEELTSVLIESQAPVKDQSGSTDVSPLESQRSWEQMAEANLVARLEKGGLLAPAGAVDQVLDTVVNNLIVSANLNVDAHCRVLLTTPLETFTFGRTIFISRGLIDVLPDEASLALVLADELSHIALGHRTQTQFAFNNQTMLSDVALLQRFRFQRTPEEMREAGKKTIEIMRTSPYQKTGNAGLFLKALAARGSSLPGLLKANLGNQVANSDALARLAEFAAAAPALDDDKLEQIAALPLGSRVKLSPWNNQLVLVKTRPIALLSSREKMPFEVTPFVPYLTRNEAVTAAKAP